MHAATEYNPKEENLELFDMVIATDRTGMNPAGFNKDDSFESKMAGSLRVIKESVAEKHVIVATSMGKDSSVCTFLLLAALRELQESGEQYKQAFIMTSNTGMENPEMDAYVFAELVKINTFISKHNLNCEVHVVKPKVHENHLVAAIGGRLVFSMPSMKHQCAVDLKITPMRRAQKEIAKRLGYDPAGFREHFAVVIGTRFEESAKRELSMTKRGEKAHELNKSFFAKGKNDWQYILSPIAYWSIDDLMMLVALVRNDLAGMPSYTDFEAMMELYRAGNDGVCGLITGAGTAKSGGCTSRFGCFTCAASGIEDASMKSMVQQESYTWMAPLNHFRNLIAYHGFDLSKRNFIARSLNQDGSITIRPNAYSPEYCVNLLKWLLTIQADELRAVERGEASAPRFWFIGEAELVAIEFNWSKYGYQEGFAASKIWIDVMENGVRYDMPELPEEYTKTLAAVEKVEIDFADNDFHDWASGSFDADAAAADLNPWNIDDSADAFEINEEGAELFLAFEAPRKVREFDQACNPAMVANYLLRLGTVSMSKRASARFDQTVRIARQIWLLGLRDVVSSPTEIVKRISEQTGAKHKVQKGAQIGMCL